MIVQRNDVIQMIEQYRAGRITVQALARWAFDRFYAVEIGDEAFAPQDADLLGDVLDDLSFADEDSFALDDSDLQRLIARLQQP